jgi:predicted nuclease with TOPRIM domain
MSNFFFHPDSAVRSARIAQARDALRQLKQEIEQRKKKLDDIHDFMDSKCRLYEKLTQEYTAAPSQLLGNRLESLKKSLERLDEEVKQIQPEKAIADLTDQYEKLQAQLEEATNNLPLAEQDTIDTAIYYRYN